MQVAQMTVRDIMQTNVTTVAPRTTVRELTRLLADHGISGVPVVTASGAVVGVVSSTDIVRLAADESELRVSSARWLPMSRRENWVEETEESEDEEATEDLFSSYFLPEDAPSVGADWTEEIGDGAFDEFTVADIMTPVSFAMPPTASIKELAQFLLRGRIHRAVVTENDHLVGIVTSMDVLKAVADGQL
jgi:CBS domain-containing protein